jgi:hypothetical protein
MCVQVTALSVAPSTPLATRAALQVAVGLMHLAQAWVDMAHYGC